jgi:hypothetical protein
MANNCITIYGPKDDGTYVVEFRTAESEALAISIPRNGDCGDPAFFRSECLRIVRAGCER